MCIRLNVYSPLCVPMGVCFRGPEDEGVEVALDVRDGTALPVLSYKDAAVGVLVAGYIMEWTGRWLRLKVFSDDDKREMCRVGFFVRVNGSYKWSRGSTWWRCCTLSGLWHSFLALGRWLKGI